MGRSIVLDGNGDLCGWFDPDKATFWEDGYSSDLTQTHVYLYRTASGAFLLNYWDHYQGSDEVYQRASDREVAEWVMRWGGPALSELPAGIRQIIEEMEV